MNRIASLSLAVALLSAPAFAQADAGTAKPKAAGAQGQQPGQMDMSQMGPWTRKPKNEGQTRKEAQNWFKEQEQLEKKGDFQSMLSAIDFPVFMATDNQKGETQGRMYTRDEYAKLMQPFYENMPKDTQTKHKPTFTALSDSMVSFVDDYTMTVGKQKYSGRSTGLLVKRDGKWMWKVMAEPGWGEEMKPSNGTSGQPKK